MHIKSIKSKFSVHNWTMYEWLLSSICFSLVLLAARIVITGYLSYLFLVWNLFLAYVPFAISRWLGRQIGVIENRLKFIVVLSIWLLFVPNTFYIITDLFHLEEIDSAPKWFDLLLIFSFAWNGLLLGIISMRQIEMIIEWTVNRKLSLLMVFGFMWLNAFGIYIGRYLRFNSWDIITQPFSLFSELFNVLFHPLRNRMEWGMITGYAVFMALLYITIKKLAESFHHPEKNFK